MPTDNVPVRILSPVTNVKIVLLNITTLPIAAIVRTNLFVTSKIEFSNYPILEFKVMHKSQRAF